MIAIALWLILSVSAYAEHTYIETTSEEIDIGLVGSSTTVTSTEWFGLLSSESAVVEVNVGNNLGATESVTVTPLFELKGGNAIGYPLPSDLGGEMFW